MKTFSILLALLCFAACLSPSWARDEGRSIDVLAYCRKTYGDSAGISQDRNVGNSWRCTVGKREFPVDMDAACKLQYDESYSARLENEADSYTWSCCSETADPK